MASPTLYRLSVYAERRAFLACLEGRAWETQVLLLGEVE